MENKSVSIGRELSGAELDAVSGGGPRDSLPTLFAPPPARNPPPTPFCHRVAFNLDGSDHCPDG